MSDSRLRCIVPLPCVKLYGTYSLLVTGMDFKVQTAGVDEARTKLPEILRAANDEGAITIVTKRGEPYAAVVPVAQALPEAPRISTLRGSANGCYGDAGSFVSAMRDEWP